MENIVLQFSTHYQIHIIVEFLRISLINFLHHCITNCDKDDYKTLQVFYCKMWQFIQNVTFIAKCEQWLSYFVHYGTLLYKM